MMNKLLVILMSPSFHTINEPDYYFEPYIICRDQYENELDKSVRNFSLKYGVALDDVSVMFECGIK